MNVSLEIGHTPNYATVYVGDVTLYFSYHTVIGFHTYETGTVVRQNDWGPTTGKHINALGVDKEDRLDATAFQEKLESVLKWIGRVPSAG